MQFANKNDVRFYVENVVKETLLKKYNLDFLQNQSIDEFINSEFLNAVYDSFIDSIDVFEKQTGIKLAHKQEVIDSIRICQSSSCINVWETPNTKDFQKEFSNYLNKSYEIADEIMLNIALNKDFDVDAYFEDFKQSILNS